MMRSNPPLLSPDLFDMRPRDIDLGPGARFLRGFALPDGQALLAALAPVALVAPFRHMVIRGGRRMSVAMTNCGSLGWVADEAGYRYDPTDPRTGNPWPKMPEVFVNVAVRAANAADFNGFAPDACLINRYEAGARMSLHQDRNERDFGQPIVSVSLGLPAVFLWGGSSRTDRPRRILLEHGDVVVWGGPARETYHGVHRLSAGDHPLTGGIRYNLTFRMAG